MKSDLRQWMRLVEAQQFAADEVDAETENRLDVWIMLTRKFGEPLGVGQHRATFGNDRFVFKYPLNKSGEADNVTEAEVFHRRSASYPVAKCKLIALRGVPILVMEYVAELPHADKPAWSIAVDKQQVGKNRAGHTVAYDFAPR